MTQVLPYSAITVEFDHVSKAYRLGSGVGSLRHAINNWFSRLGGKQSSESAVAHFAALDNVSFQVRQGESIGLIGPNGAGKTTILKLISNITRASSGATSVRGRVSALIELGAGFHPDLSGRENIYFNAAILGMRRQEIQARFDQIVDFSGMERFLDTPVKRYSSGMYCRLGFAVAAFVNPDVLLVDEVLAVGDAAFQAKCLKRMSELSAAGTTVIFVTHNLGYLQRLCQRAVFLNKGQIVLDGAVAEVIQTYRDHQAFSGGDTVWEAGAPTKDSEYSRAEASAISITRVWFGSAEGDDISWVQTDAPLAIHISYYASRPVQAATCEVWLYGLDGVEYSSFATNWDGLGTMDLDGSGEIRLDIEPMCLMPGSYFVNVAISDRSGLAKYDIHWERHRIVVRSGPMAHGLVYLPHKWSQDEKPSISPTVVEVSQG